MMATFQFAAVGLDTTHFIRRIRAVGIRVAAERTWDAVARWTAKLVRSARAITGLVAVISTVVLTVTGWVLENTPLIEIHMNNIQSIVKITRTRIPVISALEETRQTFAECAVRRQFIWKIRTFGHPVACELKGYAKSATAFEFRSGTVGALS